MRSFQAELLSKQEQYFFQAIFHDPAHNGMPLADM
jgi:hypothetical protein